MLPSDVPSDLDLLERWRAGEQAAGSELFGRHFGAVYRFFRNKVDGDVDDLVQRTFLACTTAKTSYRGHSSFRTFLFAVARNVVCDHFRAHYRGRDELDFGTHSVADLGTTPSGVVARRREHRVLLQALRVLPLDHQIALELHYWEQLSGTDLAEALGVKPKTAQARIARARELLAQRIVELTANPQSIASTTDDLDRWAASLREYLAVDPPNA